MRNRLDLPVWWVLAGVLSMLSVLTSTAYAGTVTLSWTAPTSCADGTSPLADCPTTGFEVSEGVAQTGTYTVKETVSAATTARTYSYSPGVRCFSAKTISGSLKSDESTRVCATVPSLPPKAPQGMTVSVTVAVTVP
jgi:hypothetical protein